MEYLEVQNIAKQTMQYISGVIKPGMWLADIRDRCEKKMLELGADSFWYWDIGAFCFSGNEIAVSVSGRTYKTSERIIEENDIITIDLSPQNNNIWGDYARTIILENGKVVKNIEDIVHDEWRKGLQMEERLHDELKKIVKLSITFEDLYFHMNDLIRKNGYVNLDFSGNLGHSIVKKKEDRIYIEKGNKAKISEAGLFTFEPHISVENSVYGFKKENIYHFRENRLVEL